MDADLQHAVEEAIRSASDGEARIVASRPVAGGSINEARLLSLGDGRKFFVKFNAAPLTGMFEREAEGLGALAAAGSLRVPMPLAVGAEPTPFLVMEAVEIGAPGPEFFDRPPKS